MKEEAANESVSTRPKAMAPPNPDSPMAQLNLDNTVFAFSRIMWLNMGPDVMHLIVSDPLGKEFFEKFTKQTAILYQHHFDFLCKYAAVMEKSVRFSFFASIYLKKMKVIYFLIVYVILQLILMNEMLMNK